MQVENYQIDLASNYYLFEGNHQAQKGNVQKAREAYFKSISLASDNVDALIGLARLSETPEEKRQRLAQQEQCQSSLRNEIDAIDRDMRLANPMFQPMEKRRLANSLNTLAWLMINTQTDPREALMLSRRSCSLVPDQSAYQDTLAHCLDKNGNPKEAFRTQIKALTLEPHQLSLQRALAGFYEKAAKEIDDQP
jgi:tetratricopeptide (TPR) repeat protein